MHYRLHERSPANFLLSYIAERDGLTEGALGAVAQKLEALIKPKGRIEVKEVRILLPEGSGKFVLNYPLVAG